MVPIETEWTVVGDAKSWMDALLERHGAEAPFSAVKLETRSAGSLKRRDLTIHDREGAVALTGEVKVPYANDGASPFVETTVSDARRKALAAGSPWFFTWNLNELVLWRTESVGELGGQRGFRTWTIAKIRQREDLESPQVQLALRDGIERFLLDFIKLWRGEIEVQRRPPDEYFVHAFDSFLTLPILNATRALIAKDQHTVTHTAIDRWMREEQGWTLLGDREELLGRAAKFAVYAVANKLVFYDALRKRFSGLPPLVIDETVDTGDALIDRLAAFFDTARHETGDYETIFGQVGSDIGMRIPFYDAGVIPGWRQFAEQIDRFDLSKLDYDVIGRIFERLIDPAERHKYGQYYTRPEVVDLINAFTIKAGDDVVLDPGCGGGTFLVRSYARKRRLAPRLGHARLLEGVYGTDISPFAANLSTINLATRDLVEDANYPRVSRIDFFDTREGATLMRLPTADGPQPLAMPRFDAIVGNPPYVRQEDVPNDRKKHYRQVAQSGGLQASGRADLHVYFWGHALTLLKRDGRLGFLASSQWLDAEYGFALQGFLLENFRIQAIIESNSEPWFVGARVATVATIATRETDPEARDENIVRFVELSHPIGNLLASDGTSSGALEAAEQFRDEILSVTSDGDFDGWRVRVERQGDIRERGVQLGQRTKGRPVYLGDKWGIPLRSPNIWSELLTRGSGRWKPLAELAEVRFGVKSGADSFFYLEDWSERGLADFPVPDQFRTHFGIDADEVKSGAVVLARNGKGEVHPIERKYLEPMVHSLMDVDRYVIGPEHQRGFALMVGEPLSALEGTLVSRYISAGEAQGVPNGATVAQRGRARPWYDLTQYRAVKQLWSKSHQYRHCAPMNPDAGPVNCNLYTLATREDADPHLVAGVLNSSLVLLAKQLFGRPVGVEGNLKTEIVDVNLMLVPDWRQAETAVKRRIKKAFSKIAARDLMGVLSKQRLRRKALIERNRADQLSFLSNETEFDQADRKELDDAVLELLGIADADERVSLRDRLYDHLRSYFEAKRAQEEEAIDNKRRNVASRSLGPEQVAKDVFKEIERNHPALRRTYVDLTRGSADGDGLKIPGSGEPRIVNDLVTTGVHFGEKGGQFVNTRTKEQAELLSAIAAVGPRDRNIFVPRDPEPARKLTAELHSIAASRERVVQELVAARTVEPSIAEPARRMVLRMLQNPVRRTGERLN